MKRPSFQWYPADYANNAKLRRCSWGAKGVWTMLLGLLHDSDEYGALRWPLADIAQALGCPIKLLQELAEKDVLKGAPKWTGEYIYTPVHARVKGTPVILLTGDGGPCWFSTRLVRDEYLRSTRGLSTRFGADEESPGNDAGESERARFRRKVFEKTGGTCYHCKAPLAARWEIDHLTPRSKSGSNHLSNLVPSCSPCNQAKGDRLPDQPASPDIAPTARQGEGQGAASGEESGDGSTVSSSSSNTKVLASANVEPVDNSGTPSSDKSEKGHTNGHAKQWWRSDEGIMAKGQELRIIALPGEPMFAYKQRLFAASHGKPKQA